MQRPKLVWQVQIAMAAGKVGFDGKGTNMGYRGASVKMAGLIGVLIVAALAFGSPKVLATGTRYFCGAAVGVFAAASTVGLATRLRA
jgi:hypothetical protein